MSFHGILVVTGTHGGNFAWHGVVFVVGNGIANMKVAGNGIHYDHCWADNLMDDIPFTPSLSTKPLKTLSFKILLY